MENGPRCTHFGAASSFRAVALLTATPTLRRSMAPQPDLQGLSAREVEQAGGRCAIFLTQPRAIALSNQIPAARTQDRECGRGIVFVHISPPLRKRA
jgi:hypothetical protein